MGFKSARLNLVEELQRDGVDTKVLDAISRVPREEFVPVEYRASAYENRPLPIGYGQTISQPLMVALMTQQLNLHGDERVLEIGTGSGYQTAVLAELASAVITVERLPELQIMAMQTLERLHYKNIEYHNAQDTLGWPPGAPYDAILVTAGAPELPVDLLNQVKFSGCLVIPVGPRHVQQLVKVIRLQEGNDVSYHGSCTFVSLVGHDAWPS